MHAKIIQVSTEKEMQRITADDFLEGFVGWIADYTADLNDEYQKSNIEWFKESMKQDYGDFIEVGENSITFLEGFENEFARKQMEKLKKAINSGMPYKDIRWEIQMLINDQFDTWIYWDSMWTLEHWLSIDLDGRTFYFGGVVDYHY